MVAPSTMEMRTAGSANDWERQTHTQTQTNQHTNTNTNTQTHTHTKQTKQANKHACMHGDYSDTFSGN